jgi:hypothetical protein
MQQNQSGLQPRVSQKFCRAIMLRHRGGKVRLFFLASIGFRGLKAPAPVGVQNPVGDASGQGQQQEDDEKSHDVRPGCAQDYCLPPCSLR